MKLKFCSICGKEKKLSKFYPNKNGLYNVRGNCKKCESKLKKERHKKYPWKIVLLNIKQRCENLKHPHFKDYGLRGIENYLTLKDIKFLYIRDKAHLMKRPSIDREDNNWHYTLENCRFIELGENIAKDKRKIVLQFDLNGNFMKEWRSAVEAGLLLKIDFSNIRKCCCDKLKTAGSFIWRNK